MSVDQGCNGAVYVGANKIAEVNNWTLNFIGRREEITALGDKSAKRVYTVSDSSFTFDGNSDVSDTTGQNALINQYLSGGTLAAVFLYLYVSGSTGYYGKGLMDVNKTATAGGLISFGASGEQSEQWLTNIA